MIAATIFINLVVGCLSLWIAWQLWRYTILLGRMADTLLRIEATVHQVLRPAPAVVLRTQLGIAQIRQRYGHTTNHWLQVQQLLGLVRFVLSMWQQPMVSLRQGPRPLKRR